MSKITKTNISYTLDIPQIEDEGFLCFTEANKDIPFSIKRIYYIFDVKNKAIRGKHAHKQTLQFLFCLKGSIRIVLDDGQTREDVILDKPNKGVFLNKMIWHEMVDFNEETILLVLASDYYFEDDYIRSYQTFLDKTKKLNKKGKLNSSQLPGGVSI